MISISKADDVKVARVEPCHEESEVVGLRTAVDEHDVAQVGGERRRKAFGEFMDLIAKDFY